MPRVRVNGEYHPKGSGKIRILHPGSFASPLGEYEYVTIDSFTEAERYMFSDNLTMEAKADTVYTLYILPAGEDFRYVLRMTKNRRTELSEHRFMTLNQVFAFLSQ